MASSRRTIRTIVHSFPCKYTTSGISRPHRLANSSYTKLLGLTAVAARNNSHATRKALNMSRIPNTFANLPELPVGEHLPGGHGLDPPVTSVTAGNRLNHLMIRIRDPVETLHFYIDLMGMRTVFAMNAGPLTVYYLGFPEKKEHQDDPTKYVDHVWPHPTMAKTLGLLELNHFHGSEKLSPEEFRLESGNRPPHLGFGHLGFTIPDIPAMLERFTANGVRVIKPLGVATRESVPISDWESDTYNVGAGELHSDFKRIYGQIAVVEDPNGYWVELVPHELK